MARAPFTNRQRMSGDDVSVDEGETTMAMTAAERVRAVRERRRRREIQLTVVLHEDDMAEPRKVGLSASRLLTAQYHLTRWHTGPWGEQPKLPERRVL
jgi:hypothetical protein